MDHMKTARDLFRASARRLSGLAFCALIALICPAPAHAAISADEAVAITIDSVLGGDPGEARLFIQPEMVGQDQMVQRRVWQERANVASIRRHLVRQPALLLTIQDHNWSRC